MLTKYAEFNYITTMGAQNKAVVLSEKPAISFSCVIESSAIEIKKSHADSNLSDGGNWTPSLMESIIVLSTKAAISRARDGRRFTWRSLL